MYVLLDPRKVGIFTYGHLTFEYEPFYLGQGSNHRWAEHKYNYKGWKEGTRRGYAFFDVFVELEREGLEPVFHTVSDNISKGEALELEGSLIPLIGRRDLGLGPLYNQSSGGADGWGRNMLVDRSYMQGSKNPMHKIESSGSNNFNAKYSFTLVSPDGTIHNVDLGGLPKFCCDHNLSYPTIKGKSRRIEGWTFPYGRAKGWSIRPR